MSRINVAFAINEAYVQHLNVAVYSLLKNNSKNNVHVYILCESLSQRNRELIYKNIRYFKNATVEIIELKNYLERFSKLNLTIEYISIETYYRYILADICDDINKILYLDADILVTGDIQELYQTNIEDYYAAGVEDSYVACIDKEGNLSESPDYKRVLGLEKDDLYVNAGVLLMNLEKMRKGAIVERLFENTSLWSGKIMFQDQDILNITLKGRIKEISNSFNYMDKDKQVDPKDGAEVKIIHYNGPTKPWANVEVANFRAPYVQLYKKYEDEYNENCFGSADKYALYTFQTENIGDDIQSIAARRFLPRVDYYIDRDRIGEWRSQSQDRNIKLIANGWYMHPPYSWPIAEEVIDPLYVSMYVEQSSSSTVEKILSRESRNKFKNFGPIGARDEATKAFLLDNGVESYFSGCMTLTLQKDALIKKQDFILLTDVSRKVYEYVKKNTHRNVIYLTNAVATSRQSPEERLRTAELFLYLYQSAQCVVTERLHSALPCLALETPVLLLKKDSPVGGNKDRFSGLLELTNHMSEEDFINGDSYDIDNPPVNPKEYLRIRNGLIDKCSDFTKHNNQQSFAWSDVSRMSVDEVVTELDIIKAENLHSSTTDLIRATHKISNLEDQLATKEEECQVYLREAAQLLGIKASARRLAGNVKRKIRKR